ncbi:hypothetical protein SHAQ108633_08945 [Shewanella aquimarina]
MGMVIIYFCVECKGKSQFLSLVAALTFALASLLAFSILSDVTWIRF